MTSLKKLWQLRRSTMANNIVILLMLFGIAPLAILFLIFQQVFWAYETESIGQRQQESAHHLAERLSLSLQQKRALLQELSHSWQDTVSKQQASRLLHNFLKRHPEFEELTLLYDQGRVVAKAAQDPVAQASEAQDPRRDPALAAVWSGKTLVIPVEQPDSRQLCCLTFLLPLKKGADTVVGVLEAVLPLPAFLPLLSGSADSPDSLVYLANAEGYTFGRRAGSGQEKFDLTALPAIQALAAGTTGIWRYPDSSGRKVLAVSALIPGTGLGVILERSDRAASRQVYRIAVVFLSLFVVVILMAVFRGLLFSHDRIIGPVKALQQEIETLSRGVFPQGVPTSAMGRDEIGQLSLAFHNMVEHLKKTMVSRDLLAKEVAERTLAEEALRRQEATLRSILLAVPIGIGSLQHWTLVGANESLYKLTGLGPDELLGQEMASLFVNQKDYQRLQDQIQRALVRQDVVVSETRWRRQGEERDIYLKFAPVKDGHNADLVFAAMDISDLKKMEQERLRIDKLESLGILAGGIAHDFNNILTVILGNIELVGLELTQGGKCKRYLAEADEACRRAQHLAKQLLTFAKGGMPLKKPVDPALLVQDAIPLALSGSQSAVEMLVHDDLWPVEVDEDQMHQVLHNILINADQAMPTGGRITVAVQNCLVTKVLGLPLPEGRYVRISITDEGVGISPKDMEKIFDPYFTTKQLGNGLGLTAAYAIVKNHQGHISVESRVGKGSCFRIYLPVSPVAAKPAGPKITAMPRRGQGRILVMDDEAAVREVLSHMLTRLGYEPVCVKDGGQALQAYQQAQKDQRKFAAVILDLTVPGGLGGKETVALLRQLDPEVRAIVSSGYGDDPILAHYGDFGFHGVIAKPYKITDLSQVLHTVLTNKLALRPGPQKPARPSPGKARQETSP
ncbi:MAG: hybrid sensor histidine kinase/response regulator [Desulfobacca sp.]|uniref:hybrid sensor histidine kinase/response regulator n=1 Tax=Desulfobacca sp. TaxID=2067990 RepID=UPI00404B2CB9